jgi:hypothetical protein
MTRADLPDVFGPDVLAKFLGISDRQFRERRRRADWPFSPIAGFPAKGKAARWSKTQVLAVVDGQAVSRTRRGFAA